MSREQIQGPSGLGKLCLLFAEKRKSLGNSACYSPKTERAWKTLLVIRRKGRELGKLCLLFAENRKSLENSAFYSPKRERAWETLLVIRRKQKELGKLCFLFAENRKSLGNSAFYWARISRRRIRERITSAVIPFHDLEIPRRGVSTPQ